MQQIHLRLLLAILLVGSVACKPGGEPRAAVVTIITGLVEITGNGEEPETRLLTYQEIGTPPARFQQGELLETDENSSADLSFPASVEVRIGSESKLMLSGSKLVTGDSFKELVFDLNQGAFAYKSDRLPEGSTLIIKTPTALASVRGTEFVLRYANGVTELLVQSGAVDFGPPGVESSTIEARQKATLGQDGRVQVREQTPAERQRVERFLAGLGDPNRKKLDQNREFASVDAIRAHYGEVHVVTMDDGRVYTGYVARHGELTKVHTTYGVVEIPESKIETITEPQ